MRIGAVLAPIALAAAATALAAPAPITGHWLTVDGKAIVEVGPCSQQICGRIVRILKPDPGKPLVDSNNPDPNLRGRSLIGLVFLTGFTPDDDRWRGRIYDPESGKTYRSEVRRDGNNLAVKGCIAFFCRSQTWTPAR